MHPAHRPEREPAALVRQRDRHVHVTVPRQRLERVELEPVEVVEAVDEDRRAAPAVRAPPSGACRSASSVARRIQLGIHEPGGLEALAVGAVDRCDLVRVLAARAIAGPVAQSAGETRGADLVTNLPSSAKKCAAARTKPGWEADSASTSSRARRTASSTISSRWKSEARRPAKPTRAAISPNSHSKRITRAPKIAPALRQLALGVLDVGERRHHQNRVLVEPRAEAAQHLARLGGVGRTRYELEGHVLMVATPPDRLTRAPRGRRRSRARRGSGRPAEAPAPPGAPTPGSAA